MGKATFRDVLGEYITKPAGKPALVPDSDKRRALDLHSAATDFSTNK